MQNLFGAGVLWGTPQTDAYGNAIANPTPVQLGISQEISVDITFEGKKLYGQNQFAFAYGRGKGSAMGKIKFAQINGLTFNSLVFGQTMTAGITADVYDTTGAAIPTTPFQITPTVPNSGTWSADLGVRNAAGIQFTRVASAPATGQYSVAAGVYTFATADVGTTVYINYQYTATSTTAKKSTAINVPMGYAPSFRCDIYVPFNGKTMIFTFPYCIANKLSMQTKLDDFAIPEIDFEAVDSLGTGGVFTYALSE
jgi:hypothetical protein